MSTLDLLDHLLRLLDEAVLPAVVAWAAWVARQWINGRLNVPPHIHEVRVTPPDTLNK